MHYSMCSGKCALCRGQCAVFSLACAVYSVQCEVCSVQCAVCSLQCAVCSIYLWFYHMIKWVFPGMSSEPLVTSGMRDIQFYCVKRCKEKLTRHKQQLEHMKLGYMEGGFNVCWLFYFGFSVLSYFWFRFLLVLIY